MLNKIDDDYVTFWYFDLRNNVIFLDSLYRLESAPAVESLSYIRPALS